MQYTTGVIPNISSCRWRNVVQCFVSDKENSWNKGNILTARWNPMSIIIFCCASSIYLANTDKILTCCTKRWHDRLEGGAAQRLKRWQMKLWWAKQSDDVAKRMMMYCSKCWGSPSNADAGDAPNNFANAYKMREEARENIHTTGRTQIQCFEMTSLLKIMLILKVTAANVNTCTISQKPFL